MQVAALVLAGGEARRLGGIDKPLIALGGRPILSHILERLPPGLLATALSANGDPARYAAFGMPVLADDVPGIGPLAGLARGLDWARGLGAEALLTIAGDTPFIPPDLLRRLSPAPAVAVSGGRRHHLVALWPVAWAVPLRAHLQQLGVDSPRRAFGVRAFADRLGIREVVVPDAPFDPFFNVNTPEDRDEAERLAADAAFTKRSTPTL